MEKSYKDSWFNVNHENHFVCTNKNLQYHKGWRKYKLVGREQYVNKYSRNSVRKEHSVALIEG